MSIEQLQAELEFHKKQAKEFKKLLAEFPAPRTRNAVEFHKQRIRSLKQRIKWAQMGTGSQLVVKGS